MNYAQARQIGPEGPAPGKWNWTSVNDGISDGKPYTVEPCRQPWDKPGQERCDHPTQEEAERHRWRFELSRMTPTPVDKESARELHRCDMPDCPNWADYSLEAPFYISGRHNDLCQTHLHPASLEALNPFVPGMQEVHS